MDMNTIEELVPCSDPAQWREGDAWLAGGTVLFSYGSQTLRRLLDLTSAQWTPIEITAEGIELAASCTIAQLYALPDSFGPESSFGEGRQAISGDDWPALELVRQCCDAFVASFKIWNVSTVGGNICTSLPAGPMISLCAALDAVATVIQVNGEYRRVPLTELIIGDAKNSLGPGELLRSVFLPAKSLSAKVAFRRLSLSNLGRSGVLLIGRLEGSNAKESELVITVTAATKRPVQLRFLGPLPTAEELNQAIDAQIPQELYHDDIHGHPVWRRDMSYRLAQEILAELRRKSSGTQDLAGGA